MWRDLIPPKDTPVMQRTKPAVFHRLGLMSLMCCLAACGSVMDSDKVNYKNQTEAPPATSLEVPPDLSKVTRNKRFDVPGGSISANDLDGVKPADAGPLTSPLSMGDIQVKRSGNQMWLEIARPPEDLWVPVRDFWKESGFTLLRDEQGIGVMETDWAENRAKLPQDFIRRNLGKVLDSLYSTGERDKFRIRLDRTDSNHTELYVVHRGMVEVYADKLSKSTVWQPRANDPELEKEFLRRIMLRLAPTTTDNAKAFEGGLAKSSSQLISLGGKPAVTFNQGFDVTWRRVGVLLDRNGFTVEDRDRKQGIYFVRYVDMPSDTEEGFFSKLFSSSKNNKGPEQYRLKISSPDNSASTITILNASGQADGSSTAQKIAQLLVKELQ
jgi:outer membrane protein assembly factor BamC